MMKPTLKIRRTTNGKLIPIVSGTNIVGVTSVQINYDAGRASEVILKVLGRYVILEEDSHSRRRNWE